MKFKIQRTKQNHFGQFQYNYIMIKGKFMKNIHQSLCEPTGSWKYNVKTLRNI